MILNTIPLLPPPHIQRLAPIRHLIPDRRRSAKEHTHLPIILINALPLPALPKQFHHLVIVLIHDLLEIRTSEMCWIQQTRDG